MTGQPGFGHLVIDYAPSQKLVKSKSLKLLFLIPFIHFATLLLFTQSGVIHFNLPFIKGKVGKSQSSTVIMRSSTTSSR